MHLTHKLKHASVHDLIHKLKHAPVRDFSVLRVRREHVRISRCELRIELAPSSPAVPPIRVRGLPQPGVLFFGQRSRDKVVDDVLQLRDVATQARGVVRGLAVALQGVLVVEGGGLGLAIRGLKMSEQA